MSGAERARELIGLNKREKPVRVAAADLQNVMVNPPSTVITWPVR